MFSISRASRRAFACSAIAAYAGAFALLPTEVGSRLNPQPLPPLTHERSAAIPPPVATERDPFAALADDEPQFAPPAAPFAKLRPLPPNAGAGALPFTIHPAATRVLAVVTGPNPSALVEEHERTHLVAIGDVLDGSRVVTIDAGGLDLEDGRRLAPRAAGAVRP